MFVTFQYGVLGHVRYLIVSIPDLFHSSLLSTVVNKSTFQIFTFKCIEEQIFPLRKVGKNQHRVILKFFVDIKSQMLHAKVSKGAKIRNRYNQVPHLTQDTNGKVTKSQ